MYTNEQVKIICIFLNNLWFGNQKIIKLNCSKLKRALNRYDMHLKCTAAHFFRLIETSYKNRTNNSNYYKHALIFIE